jgi:hypothetical protein
MSESIEKSFCNPVTSGMRSEILEMDCECVIGQIQSISEYPDSDLVIFLDGDVNNHDEENVIDFDFFQNAYSYGDFVEDFVLRDRLIGANSRLKSELDEARNRIADLVMCNRDAISAFKKSDS